MFALFLEVELICEARRYEYWGDEYLCLIGVRGLDSVWVNISKVGVTIFVVFNFGFKLSKCNKI